MVMQAAAVTWYKKNPANFDRSEWQQHHAYFSSSVCRGDLNTSECLRSPRKEMPVPCLDKALPLVGKLIKGML